MSPLNVLIAGSSIAGPATAYWLSKTNCTLTIIERWPSPRPGGQAIDIRTAGVSVMRKIPGMEAAVLAKSAQEEGVCFVRADGRPYGTIRATGNPEQQGLISEYEILRGDLAGVLVGFTKGEERVRYVYGETIAAMRYDEVNGPVTVEFSNGMPTSTYDLVIACDGAMSRTRAMGFECGVRDHVVRTNSWAAYFSITQDLLQGSRVGQGFSAVGGRFISVGSDAGGGSRVMLMGVHPGDKRDTMLGFREASTQGEDALKKYLARLYRGVGWKTDEVMRMMMDSEDFYASEIVQVKMPSLHNGRVVLVGDAGYAAGLTGGGTSLALAGAYMLAGEIGKHKGDLAAGLEGYEEQMRPLIKEMQKIPPLVMLLLAPQTAWGIWLRNHIFAFIAWTGIAEIAQKYLGGAFANTESFPLPEYEWVA
ncbi:FAD/NAD(P)-binding domain-containing protein [Dothidotthia symphoricarpi CBS 119687]|uniref:FAD/NAD(P)-binding domain-containing protein n=1 Tax=Dothidotthia symphoricarpi CBS 119687 TaxID=1392245 RepID=A0A6A6A201_9PLEO|nr:FAD/NAD(P)-binding domain-containing protein [Dothidotthia symphoricarpi CBS 119687]KAF2124601.1 FAD/NAD(P)-binding domain-containing protein [Dothidotthia symphoricarpi CBS 119687]